MKSILFLYTTAIVGTACATDSEPATSELESKLAILECGYAGWGIEAGEDVVFAAEEYGIACDPDPFGDPWGFGGGGFGGGQDPGICSFYDGSVTGSGTGTGRATVGYSDDPARNVYQEALHRAEAEGTSQAKFQATSHARSNCNGRVYFAGVGVCRGRSGAGFGGAQGTGCSQSGAEYPAGSNTVVVVECGATAYVDCQFEWSLY